MRKRYFYIIFIILVLMIIGIALFNSSDGIKVSAYTYPYNYISNVNSEDIVDIKLFVSEKNTYFTDINKITSAYISGNEGKVKLKIIDIDVTNSKIKIKENDYYYAHLYFKVDLNIDSDFELKINKAYLNLSFSNDKQANICIGSFSYYKYQSSNDDVTITNLKAITKKQNEKEDFYGFVLGIRNISIKTISINDIVLLDTNIKKLYIKEIPSIVSSYSYDDYFSDNNFVKEITLNKEEVKYYAISIEYNNNDLMFPVEGAGLRLKINDNDYIMEKFTFFKINKLDVSNNFIIYEYKN